ncbi:DUF2087 domain-containing protein [Cytobacillus dafuensis]|uniref:DUF2087 domain-containing protein n=1 Tax=Cytobacillus dafuensis TaxID=1742359 RepID=A0A5B8Z7I6_CYTDA|nr:DUF2087 domain-containing protein [Cytobacillus dafuensis]QED48924.1 DUF2087 domain-containing protein [Cytobacillus dafuensis]
MYIEKFHFTEEERKKTIEAFIKNGVLRELPSKEKRKVIILLELIKKFEEGSSYSEKEVNEIIKNFYKDFAILRRYLVDYQLLERSKDCSSYWINSSLAIKNITN